MFLLLVQHHLPTNSCYIVFDADLKNVLWRGKFNIHIWPQRPIEAVVVGPKADLKGEKWGLKAKSKDIKSH
jgi:hypothetical protein